MKKNFTWSNFSERFIKAVIYSEATPKSLQAAESYKSMGKEFLMSYITDICSYPNTWFVKRYRKEIENYFLNGSNYLLSITKELASKNYKGIAVADNETMLLNLSRRRLTDTICNLYLRALVLWGRQLEDIGSSIFSKPVTVDLITAESGKVSLFPYQENAVEALNKHFIEDNRRAGVLVMPTGNGKTRTAVCFLLKNMVSRGYQVLWLVHRNMLVEQAADIIYRFSPLVKDKNDKLDEFKMVCISGDHSGVYEMEKNDNVIVSSVQSLCNKTMYLSNILGDKVIIVVDEAHHTIALSYKRIIKAVTEKIPSAKLLGLTATPVRFTNKDTEELMQYFDNNIVYSVSMSKLIADGTLSIPEYKRVDTDIDIETMIDIDERKYIEQRKELSPSLLEKVAKTNERNYIIVDEYIKNKDKYGKTIIFALNVIHCLALDDAFKQRGIRSSYVYTMNGDNNEVIERFRHNEREDGIDVLININILTEGSDIPNIQTVFLTRPTSSDTLLMQMVGRGMRGVACGGTDSVNIVDFCDKWSSISCWMNPMFLLADETIAPDDKPVEYVYKPMELMPVDMIRDIIKGISYNGIGNVRCDMALPVGWYDVIDSDGCDTKVLVFENQLAGYIAWRKAKVEYLENTLLTGEDVLNEFFCGFGFLPDKNELQYVLDYLRSEGTFPTLQRFKERDEVEPYIIAKELKKANAIDAIDEKINSTYEEHKDIIDSLYGDKAYYGQRVWDYIRYKNGIVPIGTRVEEVEKEFYTLSSEPQPKSIDELLDEVIDEQGDKFVEDFVRPEIAWTDKDYKSYFGVYYTQNNCIRINRLLNSVSVPEEVVKFVIYHECLHQEMPNHFKAFRAKERLYPNFAEYENFLFCKFPDFDRECAM